MTYTPGGTTPSAGPVAPHPVTPPAAAVAPTPTRLETTINVHPTLSIFPTLAPDDERALAADIRSNGLLHPIVRDSDGRILDGRSRLKACEQAGIEPRYTTYQGSTPARNYILAVNLHRRSLSRGQAAMIAVKACSESEQGVRSNTEHSARSLSEQAGVSLGRVGQALTVLRHAEDYVDQVIAGSIGLDEALKEAARRKAEAKSRADVETLAELREHSPHLADEVEAGNLSLAAALVQRDADLAEEGRRRQVATDLLCQTVPVLAQMLGSEAFARYDPERAQPERRVTRAVIDRARAALAEAAAVWEERGLA